MSYKEKPAAQHAESGAQAGSMCSNCHSSSTVASRDGECTECGGTEWVEPKDYFARIAAQSQGAQATNTEIANVILRLIGECAMDWQAGSTGDPEEDAFHSDEEELRVLVDLVNKARAQQAAAPGSLDLMNAGEMAALRRFDETCQDGEGYDVPKTMMQRLAAIGVVRRTSGSYYETTEFGLRVLDQPAPSAPGTPEAPADTARLDFMIEHEAFIAHSRDAESCRVFHRNDEGDLVPIVGWVPEAWAKSGREAIDKVRAAQLDGGQGEGKAHA